jgi:hypothetical protein
VPVGVDAPRAGRPARTHGAHGAHGDGDVPWCGVASLGPGKWRNDATFPRSSHQIRAATAFVTSKPIIVVADGTGGTASCMAPPSIDVDAAPSRAWQPMRHWIRLRRSGALTDKIRLFVERIRTSYWFVPTGMLFMGGGLAYLITWMDRVFLQLELHSSSP